VVFPKSSFFAICSFLAMLEKKTKQSKRRELERRQHRISANFFPVSCPYAYKSWPKSVNFGQLFETLNSKKLAEIG